MASPRWYIRHVPPRYEPAKPLPVVIDLHGYSSGAAFEAAATGLGKYGDAHNFVTITPEGSGDPKFVTWDTALGSADVKFFADLLDHVEHTMCIDTRRVFVAGYSQGAFMTSTLACVYADRIAAVAPNAGIRDAPGCKPSRPVPVVAFHGTADRHIAYRGGLGPDGLKLPAYDGSGRTMGEEGLQHRPPLNGAAIPVIAAAWAKRNGCTGEADDAHRRGGRHAPLVAVRRREGSGALPRAGRRAHLAREPLHRGRGRHSRAHHDVDLGRRDPVAFLPRAPVARSFLTVGLDPAGRDSATGAHPCASRT